MLTVMVNRLPLLSAALSLLWFTAIAAEPLNPVPLPKPRTEGGMPLMQALKNRSTSRAFSPERLPPQVLSNLLWAAFGVNRPDGGKRTAASAMNWQEIDIYVALADGLYRYEAAGHRLEPVVSGDLRALTGRQSFVAEAPVNLIYVADLSRMGKASKEERDLYSAADAGLISQNVYLFCASEGMATVVRGAIDRDALARAMRLRPDQKIILAQSIGYPKK